MAMLNEFLAQHAVFTVEELDCFLSQRGSTNRNTRKALLTYYLKKGRIIRVRRGLYAVVPLGAKPALAPVDPYLLAAKMTDDAALAYHTALEFYGKAYSVFTTLYFASARRTLPLEFMGREIRSVPVPKSLCDKGQEMFGVNQHERSGVTVRVTNSERTLVDVLDRPQLAGSWEEIWRSLESVEFFDMDSVVEYVKLLGNATTAAKVGFFLEQHREDLMIDEMHLGPLRQMRPRQPHYLERGRRKDCRLIKDWSLMIPDEILTRSWEKPR